MTSGGLTFTTSKTFLSCACTNQGSQYPSVSTASFTRHCKHTEEAAASERPVFVPTCKLLFALLCYCSPSLSPAGTADIFRTKSRYASSQEEKRTTRDRLDKAQPSVVPGLRSCGAASSQAGTACYRADPLPKPTLTDALPTACTWNPILATSRAHKIDCQQKPSARTKPLAGRARRDESETNSASARLFGVTQVPVHAKREY